MQLQKSSLILQPFSTGVKDLSDQDHYKEGVHNAEYDHEAFLGSKAEAQKFHDLPPEEARRRLGWDTWGSL